jgi:UDP-N-acetylglucosamine 2-epimerase (non-hydrolysing)
MKILTVLGTRPEIIRLSRIIPKLDETCKHVLVHTGQNFDPALSDVFFDQLGVRSPDHYLGARGGVGEQVGTIIAEIEHLLISEKPDRFLVLGDTNSALSAFMAKRLGIPVYHMEAGNRCYDDRVPEEVNRRVIDQCSDILMPYTERSRQNLLREGFSGENIYVTGNPILEVIQYYETQIQSSNILSELHLEVGRYFLVTLHRAENVDIKDRVELIFQALDQLQREYEMPVIVSTHPHTRDRMGDFDIDHDYSEVRFLEPFGFFEFVHLERNAACVLSDSGTVQEECCIFKVPSVTLRDVTERPETIECGSNILTGSNPETILQCVRLVLNRKPAWNPPVEYLEDHVSDTVIKIVTGF